MSDRMVIASARDIEEGKPKKYESGGEEILIARVGGRCYAVQNRCPHFGGDLSQGKQESAVITCPRHGSQFNLTDGSVVRWLGGGVAGAIGKAFKPARALKVYKISEEGQDLVLEK